MRERKNARLRMQHAVNYPQLENKLDSNIRNYEESKLFICQKSVEYMMSLKWKVEFGKSQFSGKQKFLRSFNFVIGKGRVEL